METPESFYGVFEYCHMMHDAVDYALTYEIVVISKDITTASGLCLKKGATYSTCYFDFERGMFDFINWKAKSPEEEYTRVPDESSVYIPQSELAPFLNWDDFRG